MLFVFALLYIATDALKLRRKLMCYKLAQLARSLTKSASTTTIIFYKLYPNNGVFEIIRTCNIFACRVAIVS